ncbi:MAG: nitrilase [Chloroflexi bacterium]|nr:nitrilase [Chloroflexota bacterium]
MSATPKMTRPIDRLSWLWLILGAALLPFTALQTELFIAAWLAPIFLMRFARAQRAFIGLPLVMLASITAVNVAARGIVEGPLSYMVGGIFGLAYGLPYLVDRLLAPRLTGLASTLIFPAAVTTASLGLSILSPYGTWAAPAYSQYGILPLVQLVSLTGIWGLTFLIAWGASIANAVWEHGLDERKSRRSAMLFGTVLALVLLFGSARLAFNQTSGTTVRVAALAPDETRQVGVSVDNLAKATDAERAAAKPSIMDRLDDLLARSQREARAGATIVSWAEGAAVILKEDEPEVLDRAGRLAREEGIYLQMGLVVVRRTDQFPFGENRAVLIDPSGRVIQDYFKTVHPLGDATLFAPGPGIIAIADTPVGRLASAICFDLDFPALLRQTGRAGAGMLLAPASDWGPVGKPHAQNAAFRAIENGVSMVRPARQGLQIAVDPEGRVIASADSLTTNQSTLVAVVPTQSVWTLYPVIGDAFAYLCIAGLVGLIVVALMSRRMAGEAVRTPVTAARQMTLS